MKRNFVSGVVEGFYGRPWSECQRINLFQRLDHLGLNTYLYAPKDDTKHRQLWRDLYSKEETIQLKYLIDTSRKFNITFVYAISPGVDIIFSNPNDIYLLKQKMNQVLQLGCDAFSLLFDDISTNLSDVDKSCFVSLANAQVTLTNDIYEYLNQPRFFLFCPTEYCATRAIPCVKTSEYLLTIGSTLKPEIDIMWTGPKVISKFITLDSVLELCDVLKRPPVIWDNIHANDYDQRRLFLGPFCGRSSELIPHLRGILTNPNCEFGANFVAIHTLAQWVRTTKEPDNLQSLEYFPSRALEVALTDWLEVLYQSTHVLPEHNTSASASSANESLSPATVVSLPVTSAASQLFSLEHSNANSKVMSPITHDIINVQIIYPNEESVDEILLTNIDIDDGISSEMPTLTADFPTSTEDSTKNSSECHCKHCYKPFPNTCTVGQTCVCLIKCGDKTCVVQAVINQNEMESSDTTVNVFPLTPMETEENQNDADNVIDHMAMQVDIVNESNCEIMDVIDEANNARIDREINKELLSLNAEESEMDETISNASLDLSNVVVDQKTAKLTIEDLNLLVHMFFLPYEHGPFAVKMLQLIHWIKCNACTVHSDDTLSLVGTSVSDGKDHPNNSEMSLEWHEKAKEFSHQVELVRNMVYRLCAIPNRSVLFDLYPYIQELRHVLETLNSYVKWMGSPSRYTESFLRDDHEPWMFRGGVTSEFQRMLPLEGSNDLFPNGSSLPQSSPRHGPSLSNTAEVAPIDEDVHIANNVNIESLPLQTPIFLVRPYTHSDKRNLYYLSLELLCDQLSKNHAVTLDELNELHSPTYENLAGDRYLGHFLEFCPETCLILENEHGRTLGYGLGSSRIKEIFQFHNEVYLEKMRLKYTSKFNTLSQETFSTSVLKTLIDGLFNEKSYINFQKIKDRPQALVHLYVLDCCKLLNSDTVDTLTRRLLTCLSSALRTNSTEILYDNLLRSPSDDVNELNGDHLSQDNVCLPTSSDEHSAPLTSMAVCCEVDAFNTFYAEFCVRCGFRRCEDDDDGGVAATSYFMSRFV